MPTLTRLEDLLAWQKSRQLLKAIYAVTSTGPFARDFAFRDQIRRAALSIPSNIAEGFERGGDKEFKHFLSQAKASAGEVQSQLYNALDVGHLTPTQFRELYQLTRQTSQLIGGFMKYLATANMKGQKLKP